MKLQVRLGQTSSEHLQGLFAAKSGLDIAEYFQKARHSYVHRSTSVAMSNVHVQCSWLMSGSVFRCWWHGVHRVQCRGWSCCAWCLWRCWVGGGKGRCGAAASTFIASAGRKPRVGRSRGEGGWQGGDRMEACLACSSFWVESCNGNGREQSRWRRWRWKIWKSGGCSVLRGPINVHECWQEYWGEGGSIIIGMVDGCYLSLVSAKVVGCGLAIAAGVSSQAWVPADDRVL